MSFRIVLSGVGLCMLVASNATAQDRPDFSGRWTVATASTAPARGTGPREGDMGSGWGSTITLTQTAAALTLEWPIFSRGDLQPPLTFVYPLDGSEKTNAFMMGRGWEKQISRTVWDAGKLVITTTQAFPNLVPGQTVTTRVIRTLSLDSPTSMVVETTRNGVLGGQSSTTRTVYTKA
jgi:hypothetical protein